MSYGNKGAEGPSVGPNFVEVYVQNQMRGSNIERLSLKLLNTDYPFVVDVTSVIFSLFLCVCVYKVFIFQSTYITFLSLGKKNAKALSGYFDVRGPII